MLSNSLRGAVRASVERVMVSAPARTLFAARYERRFAHAIHENLFRGVYDSFDEAVRSAPSTKPIGYDQPGPAAMYEERLERVFPADYPVLFWLSRILPNCRKVFDFGGHVGVAYYAYQRYLTFPEGLQWTVCDVPAVVAAGQALSRERGASGVHFTSRFEAAEGADLFFASGSLQYIEEPLAAQLSRLANPPRELVVNLLPLTDGPRFATLQNIGPAFCPYAVFNRQKWIEDLQALGYRVVDRWDNAEKSCWIPAHRERSLSSYAGLYLRRDR